MTWHDIWCDVMWYDVIWCDMMWYDMIWYDMIRYDTIRYDKIGYMMYGMIFTANWFPPSGSGRQTCIKLGMGQQYANEEKYTKQYKNTEYTK